MHNLPNPHLLCILLLLLLPPTTTSQLLKISSTTTPTSNYTPTQPTWLTPHPTYLYTAQNTTLPPPLNIHRWSYASTWGYNIPLTPGIYTITLQFVETWYQDMMKGGRVFDVRIWDDKGDGAWKLVESMLDVWDRVGKETVYQKVVPEVVVGGVVKIRLDKVVGNSMISGILLDRVGDVGDEEVDEEGMGLNVESGEGVKAIAAVDVGKVESETFVKKFNLGGGDVDGFRREERGLVVGMRGDGDGGVFKAASGIDVDVGDMEGEEVEKVFMSARFGEFSAKVSKLGGGNDTHVVCLMFAEVQPDFYQKDARVFGVTLNGYVAETSLDVYDQVGKETALVKCYLINAKFSVTVSLHKMVGEPILSGVVVIKASDANVIIAPLNPSELPPKDPEIPIAEGGLEVLKVNIGPPLQVGEFISEYDIYMKAEENSDTFSDKSILIEGSGSLLDVYQSHRFGDFAAGLPVPASGTYTVTFLFAEINTDCQKEGGRVFSIKLGDVVVEKALDVFKLVGKKALSISHQVTTMSTTIDVTLNSVTGPPMLSGMIVSTGNAPPPPMEDVSVADPDQNGGANHRAHAVAKGPYIATDFDDDRFGAIMLNADGSHTHYFKPGVGDAPPVSGFLVNYEWKNMETGELLANGTKEKAEVVTANFPLGTTSVQLTVIDNTGSVASDTTSVTVLGANDLGAFCYWYDFSGKDVTSEKVPIISGGGDLKPTVSALVKNVSFANSGDFPPLGYKEDQWAMRCTGNMLIDVSDTYSFYLSHIGPVEMLIDGKTVMKSAGSDEVKETKTKALEVSSGLRPYEILYYKKADVNARLVLSIEGGFIKIKNVVPSSLYSFTPGAIVPVITSLSPSAALSGGGLARLQGSGFFDNVKVLFDDQEVPNIKIITGGEIQFLIPESSEEKTVKVTVTTSGGTSNSVKFTYASTAPAAVKFKESFVLNEDKEKLNIAQITSLKYGPDGLVYAASLTGFVYKMSIDKDHVVTSMCQSKQVGEDRGILGIGFNYKTGSPNVYITTNTIFWKEKQFKNYRWDNGKVEMVEADVDGECLAVTKTIVSGLPVSNHDHGNNDILFTDEGDMLVQIGSSTNGGVSVVGDKLGGVPDSPLSGSLLIAYLSKPDFNGEILYDQYEDPGTANLKSPSTEYIDTYATGLRNSFSLVLATNGKLYESDNGPNKGFGAFSTSCTTSAGSYNRPDQLVSVTKGGFYGFPNRNRGRKNPAECVYRTIDDEEDQGFTKPMATIESAISGLIQYTARTFSSQLKGELLGSRPAYGTKGTMVRVSLNAMGDKVIGAASDFYPASGVRILQTAYGALYMPRIYQSHIVVLEPDYTPDSKEVSLISVTPFRGPAEGGNSVLITGHNFVGESKTPSATFGGTPCTNVTDVADDGTSFRCTVPPASEPSAKVEVIVNGVPAKSVEGVSMADNVDYMYTT